MERQAAIGSHKFFREILSTGDPALIVQMLDQMEKNRAIVHNDIANLIFYMQGGVDINDAYCLSIQQRKIMNKVIEKHYEKMNGTQGKRLI